MILKFILIINFYVYNIKNHTTKAVAYNTCYIWIYCTKNARSYKKQHIHEMYTPYDAR